MQISLRGHKKLVEGGQVDITLRSEVIKVFWFEDNEYGIVRNLENPDPDSEMVWILPTHPSGGLYPGVVERAKEIYRSYMESKR